MKKKLQEIPKKELKVVQEKKISRKEAIKKTGYVALSAATMMLLLNSSAQASTSSAPPPPPANSPSGGNHGPWK